MSLALFCTAINRDSVSLLRCPLSHAQVKWNFLGLSLELSIQLLFFQFFSSRFCDYCFILFVFESILLLLAAVISLSLLFFVYSLTPWIIVSVQSSTLVSYLLPFFLDASTVISQVPGFGNHHQFLYPLVHLSSFLVHFQKGQKYFPRSSAQVFIPLMRFLLQSLISRSFLVLLM